MKKYNVLVEGCSWTMIEARGYVIEGCFIFFYQDMTTKKASHIFSAYTLKTIQESRS